ncbi:MAG: peptidylprolyl isomerase, partial [Alphaproteobacteria bacterium]
MRTTIRLFRSPLRTLALLGLAAAAFATATLPAMRDAAAQNVLRIAAIVNEDIISAYDLMSRLQLIIATTGLEASPETQRRLAPQVLRNLIEERLQLQEAQRLSIAIPDREIDRAIGNIERSNNIPEGQLSKKLEQQGIDTKSLREKIRAQIAWSRVVGRRFAQTVAIGADEVDEELRRLAEQQGHTQYRIAEIFLAVNGPDDEQQVRQSAERLIEQLRAGASFSAIAREFSQSATAAVGGDLGWITPDQLDPALQGPITALSPGGITDPIRSPSGYHIDLLIERRVPVKDEEPVFDIRQVVVTFAPDAPQQEIAARLAVAQQVRGTVKSCTDMESAAASVGSAQADRGGRVRLSQLPPELRPIIQGLTEGQTSEPIRTSGSFIVFMLCSRKLEGAPPLPSRD